MHYRYSLWGFIFALLALVVPVLAQAADCTPFIEAAYNNLGVVCGGLNSSAACYGHPSVTRVPFTPYDRNPAFFSQPGDKALLTSLVSVRTSGFNRDRNEYGLAVLNVAANLPRFISDSVTSTEGIKILLAGDASITNVVPGIMEPQSAEPVPVTMAVEARLYDFPTLNAPVREIVVAGTTLNADGTINNGAWVRVLYLDTFFWVPRDKLVEDAALASLPDLSPLSPMQAFFYTAGADPADCLVANSQVSIESPETGTPVSVLINGVEMRIRSLATFTASKIIVHRGSVEAIFPPVTIAIDAGFTLDVSFDVNGHLITGGRPRPSTDAELFQGVRAQVGMNNVARANGWRERTIPLSGTVPQPFIPVLPNQHPTPMPTEMPPVTCGAHEVVDAGETLYSIAVRYNASMPDIVQINNLPNPSLLSIGQVLCIPNPGSGFVPLVGLPPPPSCPPIPHLRPPFPPIPAPPQGLFDCSGF